MSSRLNVHPELKSLLATTNPDIFAYVESMVYLKVKLSLKIFSKDMHAFTPSGET